MKYFFMILLAAVTVVSCKDRAKDKTVISQAAAIDRFNWLTGNWYMQEKDGITTEDWLRVNDSLLEGRSDFVKGDSVIPFETIRIYNIADTFYYEAKAAGQNKEQPVAFTMTSITDSGFVAENPAHDFPKRISYSLVNPDSIHAYIDGGPAQQDKRADFFYSRKKN
jgi:hypothetical protein